MPLTQNFIGEKDSDQKLLLDSSQEEDSFEGEMTKFVQANDDTNDEMQEFESIGLSDLR